MIETREFVQFGNEGLLSLSFLLQEGILIKILLRSSKKKLGIKLSSSGGSSRKLPVYCAGYKRLGYPTLKKSCFNCFDIVVKIRRNAFRSVEGASNTISFPFDGSS